MLQVVKDSCPEMHSFYKKMGKYNYGKVPDDTLDSLEALVLKSARRGNDVHYYGLLDMESSKYPDGRFDGFGICYN